MKPIGWIGSARDALLSFPEGAIREIGHALFLAQMGGKHAFQKKSKRGIATPRQEIDKIRARLNLAEEEYAQWQKQRKP
ncbi:MAG: hypothetical protein HZA67_03775 [Rhodospirillales bacterium]|nr:hypothetical protein [Rhodospirillales bacterium]